MERKKATAEQKRKDVTELKILAMNMNGVHLKRRKDTGEPEDDSDDDEMGDGWDLRADATAKLRTGMLIVNDNGYAAAVWEELHMSKKEMQALIGMLKRLHGFEAFGTAGKYSTESGRYTKGVLVMWNPNDLLCEEKEIVQKHRIVRVKLRVMGDGSAFNLVGAYMPNQTDPIEEVDESYELLNLHATPDVLIGGDLNVNIGDTETAAGRWLGEVIEDNQLSRKSEETCTYEKGKVMSCIDHWLVGRNDRQNKCRDNGSQNK